MKKLLFLIAAVTLLAACEKQPTEELQSIWDVLYPDPGTSWTDPGISWTDYNSVHDFNYHFLADQADLIEHLGDTILIEAYNVDHGADINMVVSDSAIAYPDYDCTIVEVSTSVFDWAAQHFNEKIRFAGTLVFIPMGTLNVPHLVLAGDVELVDE